MTNYEVLLDEAKENGCSVKEMDFLAFDGLYKNGKIGIRNTIDTFAKKADVLAEEIAHSKLTVGNILDQSVTENRKQEYKARSMAYDMRIGLEEIVHALEYGCQNPYEASEYLEVSEKFFNEALEHYHRKYGECVTVGEYVLIFEPYLSYIHYVDE